MRNILYSMHCISIVECKSRTTELNHATSLAHSLVNIYHTNSLLVLDQSHCFWIINYRCIFTLVFLECLVIQILKYVMNVSLLCGMYIVYILKHKLANQNGISFDLTETWSSIKSAQRL